MAGSDELIMDERFVAVNVAGKGVVVFTAWLSHRRDQRSRARQECFGDARLHGVVGGFHLSLD